MSESPIEASAAMIALAELEAAHRRFMAVDLTPCTDAETDEILRRLESMHRSDAVVDAALIQQAKVRSRYAAHSCKNTVAFLRHLLRLTPGEARRRVRAAERFGREIALTGQVLDPIYPATAAALERGEISAEHARVIADTVEKLPDEVAAVEDRNVEHGLLAKAVTRDPASLARYAEYVRYYLDQDGRYDELAYQERRRYFDFRRRADGTARVEGELTAEAAEFLETVLDALAKPAPAEDGTQDPRTPGQRRHDALLAMIRLVMKAGVLPQTAGITTTILLHLDAEAYTTGQGVAVTGHGYGIPADLAKQWAGGGAGNEARIIAVLLQKSKRIEAYSDCHRIFTEQQRLAMIARDYGCTFPLCDSGPLHTEAHHVTEYQESQRTTVDDGTLVCGHDHANFKAMGWKSVMLDGVPWWVPPDWIDAEQAPCRRPGPDLL